MMAFVSVPKDLTKVKNKIILNLTKRQLICFGLAAAVGVPFYFLTRGVIGSSNAATGIYHMDNQLSELSEEERYRKRQLLVRPLVEALFAWLKKVRDEKMVPEGGKTMKGVNYYLNHEKQFLEFLNHGNVPLDNNATESALRNFCMHKHTWRLIDTINGAKASALVYSIVETAKANGLNPFRYLEFLLTEMMEHEEDTDYGFLDDLLPWSESIPDICKIQSKK